MDRVVSAAEQIVGRERNQRASHRQVVRNVVVSRRVNSTVMWLTLNRLFLVVLIGLVLNISTNAVAQDRVSLIKRIKRATETQEPQWKLVRVVDSGDTGKVANLEMVGFQWEFDKGRVDTDIWLFSNEDEATKWMKDFRSAAAFQTTQLPQLGVQNFVEHYPDGTVFIIFQKGRLLLCVDATQKDVALRFALLVHSQLSAT